MNSLMKKIALPVSVAASIGIGIAGHVVIKNTDTKSKIIKNSIIKNQNIAMSKGLDHPDVFECVERNIKKSGSPAKQAKKWEEIATALTNSANKQNTTDSLIKFICQKRRIK